MSHAKFCFSRDGEYFTDGGDTREITLEMAIVDARDDYLPGDEAILYTGEVTPAINFLRKHKTFISEHLIETLDDWLADDIASDSPVLTLEKEQYAELDKLILDFLEAKGSFNRYGVTSVQEHKVTIPKDDE